MKNLLTALFILISFHLHSQIVDTIILTTGEKIPCQIHNVSESGLVTYYYINSDGDSAIAQKLREYIKVIKYASDAARKHPKKAKLYSTWIRTMTSAKIKHVYTYEINKEDISVVSKHSYKKGKTVNVNDLKYITVNNIEIISFRNKGNVWKDALKGAAAGSIFGVLIALVSGGINCTDFGCLIWFALPVMGGTIGLITGAIIGSIERHYYINGNQASFDQVRQELKKHSITYYNSESKKARK